MHLYDLTHCLELEKIEHPTVKLFLPFIKEGVSSYIPNVQTKVYLLNYKKFFIPISLNNKEYDNSYVVSNYYPIASLCEKYAKKRLRKGLAQVAGLGFKALQINKVITINNCFLSAALHPPLSSQEISEILEFLGQKFPSHLMSIRSIRAADASTYKEGGVTLFKAREVFYYDDEVKKNLSKQQRYRRRKDLKSLSKYELIDHPPSCDFEKLLVLYRQVYIEKHTALAPNYTVGFLKQAVAHGLLSLKALKRDGRYVGVYGSCHAYGKMAMPFFGYDTKASYHQEVYCLLTSLGLEEADQNRVWFNDGTGGTTAKSRRGFLKQPEYVGLYSRHLSLTRRFIWGCADYFSISPTKKR